jgi:hypothetical protein
MIDKERRRKLAFHLRQLSVGLISNDDLKGGYGRYNRWLAAEQYYQEEHLISYFEWQKKGDYEVWPFLREDDYEEQLKHQPFLAGHRLA